MNEAYDPTAPSTAPRGIPIPTGQTGTEGTREELGGKENAGLPSGLDKGALEMDGEAGGTRSHPGPTAEAVAKYRRENGGMSGLGNGDVKNLEGIERFWSVEERMEPHLQLM